VPGVASVRSPALVAETHRGPHRMGFVTIFVRYVLFAVAATLVNLATQEVAIRLTPVAPLVISIIAGTGAGFAVKYILDKKWVFYDAYTTHRDEARKVTLYALFSVVTTLIFWGFEVSFWTMWRTDVAKYTGAVLGLAIGYAAKFVLDQTYVFRERSA
jgi:putative flippase GtrA